MKRIFEKILAVALCFVMLLGTVAIGGEGFAEVLEAISVRALATETVSSGTCGDNLTWTLDDEWTLTISGTGAMTDYSSSSYAPWYSSRTPVKTAVIKSGVTSIGNYAFHYYCTSLTSITIPDSVTSIGNYAFDNCTSLTGITIPDGVTRIGNYAFENCSSLTSITIPDSVTSIGNYAFANCTSLTGITIPDSVTSIGNDAFENCINLTSVTIGNSVTSIPNHAFCYCTSLTSITIPDSVEIIGNFAFMECTSLESIIFGENSQLLSVTAWAFYECTSLKSIIIPDSVTSIGMEAFEFCYGLTDITIPDGVKGIGSSAFGSCTSLTSITIPDSVTNIGSDAFENCTSLTSINVGEGNTKYCDVDGILFNKDKVDLICYPAEKAATSYYIPSNVTDISSSAFYGCANLKGITIPDSVISIGRDAFYGCANLKGITIPDSVTSIGWCAFYNCTSLTSITIPDSVTSIGNRTFLNCTSLTSITIPDSVTSIEQQAFDNCSALNDVYYGGNASDWNEISIHSSGNSQLTSATIHYADYVPDNAGNHSKYYATGEFICTESCTYGTETTDPTCSETGKTIYTCADCGYSYSVDVSPALGHSYEWVYNNDATTEADGTETQVCPVCGAKGETRTAEGTKITTYYVYFDANGGTNAPATQTKVKGEDLTITTDVPTKAGYDFLGWSTSNSATSATYSAGSLYTANASATLYAVWKIKTYTISYDANGGTFPDGSTSKNKDYAFGISVTAITETPTRSGYTFNGWSNLPEKMPASNVTVTALWNQNNTGFSKSNRYSFSNSYSNFKSSWSGGKYYLTQSDYDKLVAYINKYDSCPSSTISSVQSLMSTSWDGSCYGMASTAILDYQNKIAFNENYGAGAASMWNVKSPSTSPEIMSAINYYMVSQSISFVRDGSHYYDKDYYPSSWTPGLKKLVSTAQEGEPFLFCYYWTENGDNNGHAIVALDCTTNSDGSFSITAYDNRYPNKDVIIKVDSNYKTCVVNGDENARAVEIYTDMSAFDKIDIDGPDNDMNIKYASYSYTETNDIISAVANGDVTITNDENETITITNGVIGGTMDIVSVHMIVSDTADGEAAPVEFVFEVADSKSYIFESTDDSIDVSLKNNNMYASASAENADCIAIGNDGVYVLGENMDYTASISSKDDEYDTVILAGSADKDVSLTYTGNNILISGVNGKDETITIFAHDEMNSKDYEIAEGYEKVQVVSENAEIDIKGSSDNNDKYDVSVVTNKPEVSITNYVSKLLTDYQPTLIFNAAVKNGDASKVVWYKDGKAVATGATYRVDKATSGFTIQAKYSDDYSSVESDTETVSVNTGFFAKIIAFFRGLFKSLPVYIDNKKQ